MHVLVTARMLASDEIIAMELMKVFEAHEGGHSDLRSLIRCAPMILRDPDESKPPNGSG
jgi:hypothetical protein